MVKKENKNLIAFCDTFYGIVLYIIAHKTCCNEIDYTEILKHVKKCPVCETEINFKYKQIKRKFGLFESLLPDKLIN